MSQMKDGGAAFPPSNMEKGMSLRDWFAAMAMSGCIHSVVSTGVPSSNEGAAEYCYAFADAMIKEREK